MHKKIDWTLLLLFWWVGLISSYLWQTLHNYYPLDLDRGVSAWMFYNRMLFNETLFFGGVLEDILLFHPLGLMFGGLLALNVFKIFQSTNKDQTIGKFIFILVPIVFFSYLSLSIDGSSRITFFIFILPSIPMMFFAWKYINAPRFIIFFNSMIIFTFLWDVTSVVIPEVIWDQYSRCWFYIKDGAHSLLFSNNPKHWIFGRLPVSIDLIYPAGGMIFLTSFIGFIKWIRHDKL